MNEPRATLTLACGGTEWAIDIGEARDLCRELRHYMMEAPKPTRKQLLKRFRWLAAELYLYGLHTKKATKRRPASEVVGV